MERGYFFNDIYQGPDKEPIYQKYQAADFARFFAQIVGNGVSNTPDLPDLSVRVKQNMNVLLDAGYAFANGHMYANTAAMDLVHDTAEPDVDRIDRVVIRFDTTPTICKAFAYIKKGTPSASPVPPSLQRDSLVYELSVAQVRIVAGKSFIEQYQITDERTDDNVCGYIPLHNIYRGLTINQDGMVTMQNQSFVKTQNDTPFTMSASLQEIPFGTVETDKQGEVINGTTFKAKADGVYQFWLEMAWPQDVLPVGTDVQLFVYVNGVSSFPMEAKVFSDTNDNFLIKSGFDELKQGDEVTFRIQAFRLGTTTPQTSFTRIRIAKLA
jgi:hypothetical protein